MRTTRPNDEAPPDEPLPATLAFVLGLATLLLVGWAVMFVLLLQRWR